jgi:transposase
MLEGGNDATATKLPELSPEAISELDQLYRTTGDVRLRMRAQIVLLAAEQRMLAPEIARIVRSDEQTVRTWLKRCMAEGVTGLADAPRPGVRPKVTPAYRAQLLEVVRQRPRSLGQPYSLWTLQRLADYLAEKKGIRVSHVTVRAYLKAAGIVLSWPQHKITSPDPEYEVKKRPLKTSATTSSPAQSSTMLMNST